MFPMQPVPGLVVLVHAVVRPKRLWSPNRFPGCPFQRSFRRAGRCRRVSPGPRGRCRFRALKSSSTSRTRAGFSVLGGRRFPWRGRGQLRNPALN